MNISNIQTWPQVIVALTMIICITNIAVTFFRGTLPNFKDECESWD